MNAAPDRPACLQICCHPQVGAELSLAAAKKPPKTMDDVLRDLIERDQGEAEEAQRSLLAACNGLAGLSLLVGNLSRAVEEYLMVIDAAEQNAGICDVDSLQLIHALVNLGTTSSTRVLPLWL